MIQRAQELMDHLRQDFPDSVPQLKTFSSGGFMLYARVAGEEWVLEYMPSLRAFGVSKVSKAAFAWEGFENGFKTFEEAESFLRGLFSK
jgi:hypothetical protein